MLSSILGTKHTLSHLTFLTNFKIGVISLIKKEIKVKCKSHNSSTTSHFSFPKPHFQSEISWKVCLCFPSLFSYHPLQSTYIWSLLHNLVRNCFLWVHQRTRSPKWPLSRLSLNTTHSLVHPLEQGSANYGQLCTAACF